MRTWFWIGQACLWSATVVNVYGVVRNERRRRELDDMMGRLVVSMRDYQRAYARVLQFMARWGIEPEDEQPQVRH